MRTVLLSVTVVLRSKKCCVYWISKKHCFGSIICIYRSDYITRGYDQWIDRWVGGEMCRETNVVPSNVHHFLFLWALINIITDRSAYWLRPRGLSMALWWPSGFREYTDMTTWAVLLHGDHVHIHHRLNGTKKNKERWNTKVHWWIKELIKFNVKLCLCLIF